MIMPLMAIVRVMLIVMVTKMLTIISKAGGMRACAYVCVCVCVCVRVALGTESGPGPGGHIYVKKRNGKALRLYPYG